MILGVPKEIKNNELRVAMTPTFANAFIKAGHEVLVEKGAGLVINVTDEDYEKIGCKVKNVDEVREKADIIYKVKEPLKEEYKYFRKGQIIFTYLHIAANEPLANALCKAEVTGIGYETVETEDKKLPLLIPMSRFGGIVGLEQGMYHLTTLGGGMGKTFQGVPGVAPAYVVVVGGGTAGTSAIRAALGLGARVRVLDVNLQRLEYLQDVFKDRLETEYSTEKNIADSVKEADLVVGAALIPGAKAPKLITEKMVKSMKKGSVIVDIAIDQGGSVETIDHATSHDNPIFEKYGVIHYAVANIPGIVPISASKALSNATGSYALELLNKGFEKAVKENPALKKGVNTYKGYITYDKVAESLGKEYKNLDELL